MSSTFFTFYFIFKSTSLKRRFPRFDVVVVSSLLLHSYSMYVVAVKMQSRAKIFEVNELWCRRPPPRRGGGRWGNPRGRGSGAQTHNTASRPTLTPPRPPPTAPARTHTRTPSFICCQRENDLVASVSQRSAACCCYCRCLERHVCVILWLSVCEYNLGCMWVSAIVRGVEER